MNPRRILAALVWLAPVITVGSAAHTATLTDTITLTGPALQTSIEVRWQPGMRWTQILTQHSHPGIDYSLSRLCRVAWHDDHAAQRQQLLKDLDALYKQRPLTSDRSAVTGLAARLQSDQARACRFWPLDPDRLLSLPRWNSQPAAGDTVWLAQHTDTVQLEGLLPEPYQLSSAKLHHTRDLPAGDMAPLADSDWANALLPQGGETRVPLSRWNGDVLTIPAGTVIVVGLRPALETLVPGFNQRLLQYYRYRRPDTAQ